MEPYSFSFQPAWDALHALEGDEKSVELLELLLAHTNNPLHRGQFAPGHVTATGLVLHPDGERMAMVFHARLERWLLPGGHVEKDDSSIYAAAAREVLEETGLSVSGGAIVGVDVHGIPPKIRDGIKIEPYHQHHDILIGFAAAQTELVLSEESRDLCWVAPGEFDSYAVPPNIRRAYARWISARWIAARAR
jgi:8-oxo-dGTP pyrophosphatase MutT (NUDIX family)